MPSREPPEPLTIVGGRLVGSVEGNRAGVKAPWLTIAEGLITTLNGNGRQGRVLDADGLVIAPGFVDLQCNGGHGIDLTSEPSRIWELAGQLPRYGVTAFLPTLVSASSAAITCAQAVLGSRPPGFQGA